MSKTRGYDAGDPAVVRRGRQQERSSEEVFLAALRQALESAATRLVIAQWVAGTRVFAAASPTETPTEMAFQEGRRSVGLEMWGALEKADPDTAAVLWREYHARQRRDREDDQAALTTARTEESIDG